MSRNPAHLPPDVFEQLARFWCGEMTLSEFEAWLYASAALEAALAPGDYLALISLDYAGAHAADDVRALLRPHLDMAAIEVRSLRRILVSITRGGADAFDAAIDAYRQYGRGYRFLDNIGMGFGVSFVVAADDGDLSDVQKQQIASDSAPALLREARRALHWLDTGLVQPTGREIDRGVMGYTDHRPEADRRPTTYEVIDGENERPPFDPAGG